jgi:anti-anti-sigma factor
MSAEHITAVFSQCTVSRGEPSPVLTVSGELDHASTSRFDHDVRDLIPADAPWVVLDLGDVRFLDVAGLHSLSDLDRQLRHRGSRLDVVCPHDFQRRLFAILDLEQSMHVHADLDAALSASPAGQFARS